MSLASFINQLIRYSLKETERQSIQNDRKRYELLELLEAIDSQIFYAFEQYAINSNFNELLNVQKQISKQSLKLIELSAFNDPTGLHITQTDAVMSNIDTFNEFVRDEKESLDAISQSNKELERLDLELERLDLEMKINDCLIRISDNHIAALDCLESGQNEEAIYNFKLMFDDLSQLNHEDIDYMCFVSYIMNAKAYDIELRHRDILQKHQKKLIEYLNTEIASTQTDASFKNIYIDVRKTVYTL
jgi:hypothetical protein